MSSNKSPRNGRSVTVNRGPVGKLENELKRVKALARSMRMRQKKEQYDLTSRLREMCQTIMEMNDVDPNIISQFREHDAYIPLLEQYQQAFIEYDDNLSGKMSWDEFVKACEYLDIRTSQSQLRRSFDKFDKNRDGTIGEKEFVQCVLPDVDVSSLMPLAQIANLRKNLSGIRNNEDRRRRSYDRLQEDFEQQKEEMRKLRAQLRDAQLAPKKEKRVEWEDNWKDNSVQEHLDDLEKRERQIADLTDQLRQANKELKRLQKFGSISRNTVNNMEMTFSNNLLEATKMIMIATETPTREIDAHDKQKKTVSKVFELRQAFLEFDSNHSAEMSFDEFQQALRTMGMNKSERELSRQFSRFDKDGSGYISEDEFMIAVMGDSFEEVGVAHYTNQLTDWIRRMAKQLIDDRSQLQAADHERSHLLKNKAETSDNLEECMDRNQELLGQLNTLEVELHNLRQQLKDARDQGQDIINQLELELKEAKEVRHGSILQLTDRIRVLDRENERLTRELESLNLQHEENNRLLTKKFTEENKKLMDEIIITREEYEKLQSEIERLRAFGKKLRNAENYQENYLSSMLRDAIRKVLVVEGASKEDLENYDVESSSIVLRNQLKQAFLELDIDHTEEMSFEEFVSAWEWLELKQDPKKMKSIFDTIDRKGKGYVDENEFLMSVMGDANEGLNLGSQTEKACVVIEKLLEELSEHEDENLMLRQQIDDLTRRIAELKDNEAGQLRAINELESKLISLQRNMIIEEEGYDELKKVNDELRLELKARDTEYEQLERRYQELEREYQRILKLHNNYKNKIVKNRLADMTRQLAHDISDSIKHLNEMMERETMKDQTNVNEEQIISQLYKAFGQFDTDKDGALDFDEFKNAWKFIGLQVNEDELREVFDRFDTDSDGLMTDAEFIDAIMDERLLEMNMFLLFMKLARARDDLDQFIKVRKKDLKDTRRVLDDTKHRWEVDKRSNARRRNDNFAWESDLQEMVDELVQQAIEMDDGNTNPVTSLIEEKRGQYDQIRQKFMKHDKEANGCLTFEQFDKAWLELGLPGNQTQRKRQFTYIDEDASGYLSFREFVNACVGPDKGRILGPKTELRVLKQYLNALQLQHHLSKGELEEFMKQLRELENLRDLYKESQAARERLEKELEKIRRRCAHLAEVVEQMKHRIRELTDKYNRQLTHEKHMHEQTRNNNEKRLREQAFVRERLEDDNQLLRRQIEHYDDNLKKLVEPLTEENQRLLAQISKLETKVNGLNLEKESLEIILQSFSTVVQEKL